MLRRWLTRTPTQAALLAAPPALLGLVLLAPAGLLAADEPAAGASDRESLFKKLDANGDGQVTKDEVPEDQQRIFERLLRNADKDGNGQLSAAEFAEGTKDEPRRREGGAGDGPRRGEGRAEGGRGDGPSPEQAAEIFKRADANGDGKLVPDEVPEERRQGFLIMIERVDSDGDKALTLEEFTKGLAMMRGGQRPDGQRPEGQRPDGQRPDGQRPDGQRPGGPSEGDRPRPPMDGGPGQLMFRTLDANGDGKISSEELYAAADALKKLDKDGDGSISRQEAGVGMAGGPGGRPGRPGEGGRPGEAGRPGEGGAPNIDAMVAGMLRNTDKDGDGKISKDEAPERMKENFARMDANGDGFVDEAELKQMFGRMRAGGAGGPPGGGRPGGGERMKEIDKNGDGKISKDEAPERMKENFDKIDANGDGQLDQEELQRFFGAMRQRGDGERPKRDGDSK